MQNFKSNKQAKGFSLLELMLVLAAIVFLGALAINQYNKYRINQSATEEAQNLATAAAAVKALYTRGDYSTLSPNVAAKAKFFPDNMVVGGATIKNQWDGDVVLGPVTNTNATNATVPAITAGATTAPSAGSTNRFFGITYAAVPADVCIKLAGAAGPTFDKIGIAGTLVKNTVPGANPALMNEAEVATRCASGTNGAGVLMTFITN